MTKNAGVLVLAISAALVGCKTTGSDAGGGAGTDGGTGGGAGSTVAHAYKGHFATVNLVRNQAGQEVGFGLAGHTATAVAGTITEKRDASGTATSVSMGAISGLNGGASIPASASYGRVAGSGSAIGSGAEFSANGDSFLEPILSGTGHVLHQYGTTYSSGGHDYLAGGYVTTGTQTPEAGRLTSNATFNGKVVGIVLEPGEAAGIVGDVSFTAAISGAGGTMSGVATDMMAIPEDGAPAKVGVDLVFAPAAINGSAYQGKVDIADRNGNSLGVVKASDYQGAFYGANAESTAGTFQAELGANPQTGQAGTAQIIGGFSASR